MNELNMQKKLCKERIAFIKKESFRLIDNNTALREAKIYDEKSEKIIRTVTAFYAGIGFALISVVLYFKSFLSMSVINVLLPDKVMIPFLIITAIISLTLGYFRINYYSKKMKEELKKIKL